MTPSGGLVQLRQLRAVADVHVETACVGEQDLLQLGLPDQRGTAVGLLLGVLVDLEDRGEVALGAAVIAQLVRAALLVVCGQLGAQAAADQRLGGQGADASGARLPGWGLPPFDHQWVGARQLQFGGEQQADRTCSDDDDIHDSLPGTVFAVKN
jgi:hypothetical protein